MCTNCNHLNIDFEVEHTETMCPLRNSFYCSNCASYGHLFKSCPSKPSIMFREPVYLEQLISPSDLKKYNINSVTPLQYKAVDEPRRIIEI